MAKFIAIRSERPKTNGILYPAKIRNKMAFEDSRIMTQPIHMDVADK